MWLWVLIVGLIGLGIYLGVTLRDVWRSGKKLAHQAGELSQVAAAFSLPIRDLSDIGDVYADPARLAAARADRRRIRALRAEQRRRRLAGARGRWEDLNETSFDSIGPQERERARERVKGWRE